MTLVWIVLLGSVMQLPTSVLDSFPLNLWFH
jgi:NADH-quinone oxidoreductase subunit H